MCGRYSLTTPVEALVALFDAGPPEAAPDAAPDGWRPRYNAAPSQALPVVRCAPDGARVWAWLRWGLVPSWADDPAIGNRLINARSETAAAKPSFRAAFRRRRCLVPADGFYEWQQAEAPRAPKQPFHIAFADHRPFAFAGLWEHWQRADASLETFTILTTDASPDLAPIHNRMPVILAPEHHDVWLGDGGADGDVGLLQPLLAPWHGERLRAVAVGRRVNSPHNDDAACLAPVDADPPPPRPRRDLFG